MRKHVTRAAAVVVAAGLAYGVNGTGAWFTSSDESATNTVDAAQLSIDMRENGGRFGGTLPQTIGNLAPGEATDWAISESLNIFNEIAPPAGLDAKYRLTTQFEGGNSALYDWVDVEVRDQFFVGPVPQCGEAGTLLYQGPLRSMDILSSPTSGHGVLPAGNSHKFCLQFELSADADDSVQGATADFQFVVDATQVNAPDPA